MNMEYDNSVDFLLKHTPESGTFPTKIQKFGIARRDKPNVIERCMVKPVVIVAVQREKRLR